MSKVKLCAKPAPSFRACAIFAPPPDSRDPSEGLAGSHAPNCSSDSAAMRWQRGLFLSSGPNVLLLPVILPLGCGQRGFAGLLVVVGLGNRTAQPGPGREKGAGAARAEPGDGCMLGGSFTLHSKCNTFCSLKRLAEPGLGDTSGTWGLVRPMATLLLWAQGHERHHQREQCELPKPPAGTWSRLTRGEQAGAWALHQTQAAPALWTWPGTGPSRTGPPGCSLLVEVLRPGLGAEPGHGGESSLSAPRALGRSTLFG